MSSALLIVEDDRDILESLSTSLKTEGFSVLAASDARTALDLLNIHEGIGLVILDHVLGEGENGHWFVERKSELPARRKIPVLVVTATGNEVTYPNGIPVIRKPFDLDALLSVVQEIVRKNDS